jgi:wyosine [tRNA(Phe)-imidazoG37] synthetase (radical SAM superfamily)/SAM-dependent methyltransferase
MTGAPIFNAEVVSVMQVEPSALCTLRCLACASSEEREALEPPHLLSPGVFTRTLNDFSRAGIRILAFDFSGHGEPTLNPELPELIRIARRSYPAAFITLGTNGQAPYSTELVLSGVDQLNVALDGVDQGSYARYRVGGSFQSAVSFLRAASADPLAAQVVFRYILFNHNSDPEHIAQAWKMACDIGVDEIRFIITRRGEWSTSIKTVSELSKALRMAGVPETSLRLQSSESMDRRKRLKSRISRFEPLYRLAYRAYRAFRSVPSGRGLPSVGVDYCMLSERQLGLAVSESRRHLRAGRVHDALSLLSHVEEALSKPRLRNPAYSPERAFMSLGETYRSGITRENPVSLRSVLAGTGLLRPARAVFRAGLGCWKTLVWKASGHHESAEGFPCPPPHLCFRSAACYGTGHFLSTGARGAISVISLLDRVGRTLEGSVCLDFGCGAGRVARHLHHHASFELHCTDVDAAAVKWCRQHLGSQFQRNAYGKPLQYEDGTFDLVLAIAVFPHMNLKDQCFYMAELRRVLKPGGTLLLTLKGMDRRGELTLEERERFDTGEPVVREPLYSTQRYCLAYHPREFAERAMAPGFGLLLHVPMGSEDTGQDAYIFEKGFPTGKPWGLRDAPETRGPLSTVVQGCVQDDGESGAKQ